MHFKQRTVKYAKYAKKCMKIRALLMVILWIFLHDFERDNGGNNPNISQKCSLEVGKYSKFSNFQKKEAILMKLCDSEKNLSKHWSVLLPGGIGWINWTLSYFQSQKPSSVIIREISSLLRSITWDKSKVFQSSNSSLKTVRLSSALKLYVPNVPISQSIIPSFRIE